MAMPDASPPPRSRTVVSLVVASALFMENLDSTVIATSLPAIARDLHVDPVILKLAFTSYFLSLAVFIPISGWCADRFGARLIFRWAILVFMLGSISCGASHSLGMLVASRALQGLGGAMMVPVGRLVLVRIVPKSELVNAMAYLTVPALIGPIVGPPLGGFITTYLAWRWIFWINIPIGMLGLVLSTLFIPNIREERTDRLDVIGFFLSGIGLSTLIFGVTVLRQDLLSPQGKLAAIGTGIVCLALYVAHARRVAAPILDLRLLGVATFRSNIFGGFLFRIGVGAVPFLLPLMLQVAFGLSPFQSGSLTFISAAGALLMKFTAAPILKRFGFRPVLVLNALLSSAVLALSALFTAQTPAIVIMAVLLFGGFLRSLQFTSLNAIAFADLTPAQMSRATSFVSVVQQLSASGGVVVGAFVLDVTRSLRGDMALTQPDFAVAFLVVGMVSALSAIVNATLPAGAGAEVSGHHDGRLPAARKS
jgi:EmrB/QacA subfamily drug resistance transporter